MPARTTRSAAATTSAHASSCKATWPGSTAQAVRAVSERLFSGASSPLRNAACMVLRCVACNMKALYPLTVEDPDSGHEPSFRGTNALQINGPAPPKVVWQIARRHAAKAPQPPVKTAVVGVDVLDVNAPEACRTTRWPALTFTKSWATPASFAKARYAWLASATIRVTRTCRAGRTTCARRTRSKTCRCKKSRAG